MKKTYVFCNISRYSKAFNQVWYQGLILQLGKMFPKQYVEMLSSTAQIGFIEPFRKFIFRFEKNKSGKVFWAPFFIY